MTTPDPTQVEVMRTHLEMTSPAQLRPAVAPDAEVVLSVRPRLTAAEYIAIYRAVGERWHWRDRLAWGDDTLDFHLGSLDTFVWVLEQAGTLAGFFELERQEDATVEIMYFGLVPSSIGRGLGGWLLTRAVEESFALGATRVILNTCTLDSPRALPNYLARGFRITREETYLQTLASAAADAK